MKILNAVILIVAVMAAFAGPALPQTFSPSDAVETTGSGSINWTAGEVYASGIGAPPAYPANDAQARAMAERAAFVVALRNLIETVKGIRVDSDTVVENFMTKSDTIRTKVDGIVRGARAVKTQYLSDGSVEVLVAMPMKGAFMNAIVPDTFGRTPTIAAPRKPSPLPQRPSEIKPSAPEPTKPSPPVVKAPGSQPEPIKPAPAQPEQKGEPIKPAPPQPAPALPQSGSTVAFKGGVATGLVIDARGLGLRPALLPKIVDQQGQEVYVGQVVTRTNAVEQGVAGYAKDVNAAANNFRVTDNPAVIKGQSASGSARTDVVIGQTDAQALRQLSSKAEFLQHCRVIIVY
jgi:hypothetical protein